MGLYWLRLVVVEICPDGHGVSDMNSGRYHDGRVLAAQEVLQQERGVLHVHQKCLLTATSILVSRPNPSLTALTALQLEAQ